MFLNRDTIAAIASPIGIGGVGVIRISGIDSLKIIRQITGLTPSPRTAHYVKFKTTNTVIDSGLVIYFKTPKSYTGEDIIECHTHGNRIVQTILLDEIFCYGARPARPGEFTERAFLNGKLDLIQAESVLNLIQSTSKKAALAAAKSLEGVFSKKIFKIRNMVLKACGLAEASLDFYEDEDIELHLIVDVIKQAAMLLEELIQNANRGKTLDQHPSVVIAGPPNVGKSSLMNSLSNYDCAIVSTTPGTTRDIIKESIILKGNMFTLIDSAGIHETENEIEKEGIKKTKQAIKTADLILFVTEADKKGEQLKTDHIFSDLTEETRRLTVINKIDLYPELKTQCHHSEVYISVKTGVGIENLIKKICQVFDDDIKNEDVVFARQRQIDLLIKIKRSLNQALMSIQHKLGIEILAEHLRQAISGFDDITGKTTSNDILGEVFSNFCIGK